MQRQEIIDGLVDILKTTRTVNQEKLASITEDTDFIKDLNTPSTEMINIVAKMEHKFKVEFEDEDIDELGSTVKDIVDLVISVKERA